MIRDDAIKQRLICLRGPHQYTDQAPAAALVLTDVTGIFKAKAIGPNRLSLTYSLEYLTYETIAELLMELGFHLDNSILSKIRRAMYEYVETTTLERMQAESHASQTRPEKPSTNNRKNEPQASTDHWQKYW